MQLNNSFAKMYIVWNYICQQIYPKKTSKFFIDFFLWQKANKSTKTNFYFAPDLMSDTETISFLLHFTKHQEDGNYENT